MYFITPINVIIRISYVANKLSVNASMTNFMLLGTTHLLIQIDESAATTLDNTNLEEVDNTRFVGVTIDKNLIGQTILQLFLKIYPGMGIINKLKHFVPEGVLYSSNCFLILPYIIMV